MYREQPQFKPEEVLVYLRKSRSDDPMLTVEEVSPDLKVGSTWYDSRT